MQELSNERLFRIFTQIFYVLALLLASFNSTAFALDCPEGDLHPDCEINLLDMQIFAAQWPDSTGVADFDDQDGVNYDDFTVLAQNWGEKSPLFYSTNLWRQMAR